MANPTNTQVYNVTDPQHHDDNTIAINYAQIWLHSLFNDPQIPNAFAVASITQQPHGIAILGTPIVTVYINVQDSNTQAFRQIVVMINRGRITSRGYKWFLHWEIPAQAGMESHILCGIEIPYDYWGRITCRDPPNLTLLPQPNMRVINGYTIIWAMAQCLQRGTGSIAVIKDAPQTTNIHDRITNAVVGTRTYIMFNIVRTTTGATFQFENDRSQIGWEDYDPRLAAQDKNAGTETKHLRRPPCLGKHWAQEYIKQGRS